MIDCPEGLQAEMFDDDIEESHEYETENINNTDEAEMTRSAEVNRSEESVTDTTNTVVEDQNNSDLLTHEQATKQKVIRPQQNRENQRKDKPNLEKAKKTVSVSNSQSSLKAFMNTPGIQSSKQKTARTPPPERDGGAKSKKM